MKTAILISGRGTNMGALLTAAEAPGYPARIALVLSNRPGAEGLAAVAARGIPAKAVDHKPFGEDREAFERAMQAELQAHDVELLVLAGFMRVLTPWFITRWTGRMINIHPSLLPLFPGLRTHARALEAGMRIHGCTVHFVVPEVDAGPIIAQGAIPVLPGDDPEALAQRLLAVEHAIYPPAVAAVAAGKVRLEDGRAVFKAPYAAAPPLISSP